MFVAASCKPFVFFRVKGLDIKPKGIHPWFFQVIKILAGKSVAIGLNQQPEFGVGLN